MCMCVCVCVGGGGGGGELPALCGMSDLNFTQATSFFFISPLNTCTPWTCPSQAYTRTQRKLFVTKERISEFPEVNGQSAYVAGPATLAVRSRRLILVVLL